MLNSQQSLPLGKLSQAQAADELLKRRKARTSLLNFTTYTYPGYIAEPAHALIAATLDKVVTGEVKRLIVIAPPQNGKAFRDDTPILTTEGWKTHGKLRPGMVVYAPDGHEVPILTTSGNYPHRTSRITFSDGNVLYTSPEHEWIVSVACDRTSCRIGKQHTHTLQVETQDLIDLAKRYYLRRPCIPVAEPIQGVKTPLPLDPYLLGMWLGDGDSRWGNISSGWQDAQEISSYIQTDVFAYAGQPNFRPSGLTLTLRDLGVLTPTAKCHPADGHKHIPGRYFHAQFEDRLALLQGLMDSDGSITKAGQCEFVNMSKVLAHDVRLLIQTLGMKATLNEDHAVTYQGKDCGVGYRVQFWPQHGINPFKLERKRCRVLPEDRKISTRTPNRYIVAVEDVGEASVQCIQVEGGMYLVGEGCIPTHNSELTSVRLPAYWFAQNPDQPIILTSYASSLAESKSRQARDIVESSDYKILFPDIKTDDQSRSVTNWRIAGHRGELIAAGVGGPITGHGARLGIIDDPIENWEQAQSETVRKAIYDWYRTTFRTRIWEGGSIVLIQCMVGGTPVLMADGTERPLCKVKVGDHIATYDKGEISVSRVSNWRNNGPDHVFMIRMASGATVKANARHPFLVEEGGRTGWQRTASLKKGSIILKVTGESGRGLPAPRMDVTNQPDAKVCAPHTITSIDGQPVSGPLQSILHRAARRISAIITGLVPRSISASWMDKGEYVPFARNPQQVRIQGSIGKGTSALTTAMTVERSEDFSATTATLPLDTEKQQKFFSLPLSTYRIVRDTVIEVIPSGVEDVFDIEVEKTENFIANGLVSHNTRWHEDDLAGKLLAERTGEWQVLHLPAIAETQKERDAYNKEIGLPEGLPDPLGREPGEPLAPRRYSLAALESLRHDVGALGWNAEYQGRPKAPEGNRFKREWFHIVDIAPKKLKLVRYWDKAATEGGGTYSTGVLMGKDERKNVYILDVVSGQWSAGKREEKIRQTAELDADIYGPGAVRIWQEQEPGSGGKESAQATVHNLMGFTIHTERVTGSKEVRAEPFAVWCENGYVYVLNRTWTHDYIEELCAFPNGRRKDKVDASGGAFNKLAKRSAHFG